MLDDRIGEDAGRGVLERARRDAAITSRDLWVRYLGLGGEASPLDVESFLAGESVPARREYNLLVDALNERFMDLGMSASVRYAA